MNDRKIDVMLDDTPVDVSTEVGFIWSIANKLRGTYQSDKYKDVIIPMVIIRRFECALENTKQAVVEQYKKNPAYPAKAMCRVSGFQFFNTSEYTLAELVNDPDHLAANFRNYIEGFSANVQDIIKSLDFDKQIDKMDKNNRLLSVVKAFSELDLDPKTIDNVKMGYIFEDLIRRFSENAENIRMQDTMKADCFSDRKMRFVIENPPFGTPWGGKDAAEGVEQAVKAEHQKGFDGRFGAGLPGSGDMQLLFIQSAVNKMDDILGRAAIIENGSPLFSGGTSSGESQIRRYLLENDLIEAIIALPVDLFYNTGIATYIWVLSKNKREERRGKIQLIDAGAIFHKLRKAHGNKKNEISPEDRSTITKLYADFEENEYCKIYPNTEFIYREYTVMQPLQRSYAVTSERIQAMLSKGALSSLYDPAKGAELENAEELTGKELKKLENYQNNKPVYDSIIEALNGNVFGTVYLSPVEFMPILTKTLSTATNNKKLLDKIADGLSVMDKSAGIQHDKKGNIIYDKETKDTEIVRFDESIEDYMAREVLPHVPDAQWFFEEDLSKKNRGKCTPVVHVCRTTGNNRFYMYYLRSLASNNVLWFYANGVRIRSSDFRNYSNLGKFEISVPPISEQNEIVDYLDMKCTKIDNIISEKKQQIETIEEYKKSLIFEYVMGKKEVEI